MRFKPPCPLRQYLLYTMGRLIDFPRGERVVRNVRLLLKGRERITHRVFADFIVLAGLLLGGMATWSMVLLLLALYEALKRRNFKDIGVKLSKLIKGEEEPAFWVRRVEWGYEVRVNTPRLRTRFILPSEGS